MDKRIKDLTGKVFGFLTVIEYAGKGKRRSSLWKCRCSCDNIVFLESTLIVSGKTKSCGCFRKAISSETSFKHGETKTQFWIIWRNLRQRCLSKKHYAYKDYGGRGITYDPRWDDFLNFKKDMWYKYVFSFLKFKGDHPISIERIDVNNNYCFDNCIFIPKSQQSKNRRSLVYFKAVSPKGKIFEFTNIAEFSRTYNVPKYVIYNCLYNHTKNPRNGWKFYFNERN